MNSAKRAAGVAAAAALAISMGSAGAALAQESTSYPDANGWTFNPVPSGDAAVPDPASLEGWQPNAPSCLLLDLIFEDTGILCEARNVYKPEDLSEDPALSDGNPRGSIWTDMNTIVNVVGIFRSTGTWWSPKFTINDDAALANNVEIAAARLHYDRLFFLDEVLGESETSGRTEVTLFEEGALEDVMDDPDTNTDEEADSKSDDTIVPITQEVLTSEDTADWQTRNVDVGQTTLQPGKRYHLEFKSFVTTTPSSQLILGNTGIGYDNIRLTTTEPMPGPAGPAGAGGPGGPGGPPGAGGVAGTQVNSPEARRLLRISRLVRFIGRGKFRDQLRQRLICRSVTLRRCEGTVRIRTARRVRLPGGRHRERITLGQHAYALPPGRAGYAKIFATTIGRRLILRRAPLRVEITVTVLDQDGVQQTLRVRRTLRLRR